MSRVLEPKSQPTPAKSELPPLENGDHLDQKTFHARYEAMPEGTRAELIGGVVIMPSPMKFPHGRHDRALGRWLDEYEEATPGTMGAAGATVILGPESEPQPDQFLLVTPDYGGQTVLENDYVVGAPELAAEIASATEAYDLHSKKRDYELAGVKEYVVVALREIQVFWFVRHRSRFKVMKPGPDGIFRSEVFPGLWLDPAALLRLDRKRVLAVLRQGLASPEHAAFVARLAAQGPKG